MLIRKEAPRRLPGLTKTQADGSAVRQPAERRRNMPLLRKETGFRRHVPHIFPRRRKKNAKMF